MASALPLAEANPYALDVQLSLQEFVESYRLPQTVKVTQGFQTEKDEFSTGEVMNINNLTCNQVTFTYFRLSQPKAHHVELPVEVNPWTSFKVIPLGKNDPQCAEPRDELLKLRGVRELVKYCPLCVKVLKPYDEPGRTHLETGDRLTLLRFSRVCGVKYLECKSAFRNSSVLLDVLNHKGEFKEVESNRFLTLSDLISEMPYVARRLQLADDIQNRHFPIRGLPAHSDIAIVMHQPALFVTISPEGNPGAIELINPTLDITVSPRQDTYQSTMTAGHLLESFVFDNAAKFPMITTMADCTSPSSILERHFALPGRSLVLFNKVEVDKFVLRDKTEKYFAVPASYQGVFKLIKSGDCKQTIEDIPKVHGQRFVCHSSSSSVSWPGPNHSVQTGDVYEIISDEHKLLEKTIGGRDMIDALQVRKVNTDTAVHKDLPVNLQGEFDTLGEVHKDKNMTLGRLHEMRVPYPITIQLKSRSPDFQAEHDPLPLHENLVVEFHVTEQCVKASRPGMVSFLLPLRTQLYVAHIDSSELKRASKQTPTQDQCPEVLTAEDVSRLEYMLPDYEDLPGSTNLTPQPVPSKRSATIPLSTKSRSLSATETTPVPPPREPVGTGRQVADDSCGTLRRDRAQSDPDAPLVPKRSPITGTVIQSTHRAPVPEPKKSMARKPKKVINQLTKQITSTPSCRPPAVLPKSRGKSRDQHAQSRGQHAHSRDQHAQSRDQHAQSHAQHAQSRDQHAQSRDQHAQSQAQHAQSRDESDDSDYELVDDYTSSLKLPADGNLRYLSCPDMLIFLHKMGVPDQLVENFRQRSINGSMFAQLTDGQMKQLGLDLYPRVVRYRKKTTTSPLDIL